MLFGLTVKINYNYQTSFGIESAMKTSIIFVTILNFKLPLNHQFSVQ